MTEPNAAPPIRKAPTPLPRENYFLSQTGPTPLVPVRTAPGEPTIWCKLELLNPSGSTKDRIAGFILTKALRSGTLTRGDLVIESSSGSTSIAMAMACAQLGLRFIAVMPEGVSRERALMIRAYGGEVRFSPKEGGVRGAGEVSVALAQELGAFLPKQFENPDNAEAHRVCTAREIIAQLPGGSLDAFACGVGTGGTLVGLLKGFADHGVDATPFAARPIDRGGKPSGSPCFASLEQTSFSSRIPGVVENMSLLYNPSDIPGLVQLDICDQLALETTRSLIKMGFPVGPSSGLNFAAAVQASKRISDETGREPMVVTVFCDRMERYFSTDLFCQG